MIAMDAAIRAGYPSAATCMERFEVSERMGYHNICHIRIATVSVTAFAYNRCKPREKTAGFAVLA